MIHAAAHPGHTADLLWVFGAPFLGLAAMVLPVSGHGLAFFDLVAKAQDGYEGAAALLLLGLGVLLGRVTNLASWLLALAAVAGLPAVSIAQLVCAPSSSSNLALSPIAGLVYVFFASPVFAGAELARRLRRKEPSAGKVSGND